MQLSFEGLPAYHMSVDKLRLTLKIPYTSINAFVTYLSMIASDEQVWITKVPWQYHYQVNYKFGSSSLWVGIGLGNAKNKISIVFNPNKDLPDVVYKRIRELQVEKAIVEELDVAYDFWVPPESLIVVSLTGKDKNVYRGTHYWGTRHNDGYCKKYDKAKEQGIKGEWTRLEITSRPKKITLERLMKYNPKHSKHYKVGIIEENWRGKKGKNAVYLKALALCLTNNLMDEKEISPHVRRQVKGFIEKSIREFDFDKAYNQKWDEVIGGLYQVIGINF